MQTLKKRVIMFEGSNAIWKCMSAAFCNAKKQNCYKKDI